MQGLSKAFHSESFPMADSKQEKATGMWKEEGYEHGIVSPASQLARKPDCP